MKRMRAEAGAREDGELEKAATPAGRERTPAPTMFFTRLKTSLEILGFERGGGG
jgi:hypothetical protein